MAALERDAALERVGRTRRWILVAAAALTAGLAALASALVPGKSLGAKSHTASVTPKTAGKTRPSSGTPALPPPAGGAALGLQGGAPPGSGESNSGNSEGSDSGNSGPGDSSAGNSGAGNSGAAAAPAPAPQPAPAPAPAPSGNSGAATSGGS